MAISGRRTNYNSPVVFPDKVNVATFPRQKEPCRVESASKDARIENMTRTAKQKSNMLMDRDRRNGRLMSNLRDNQKCHDLTLNYIQNTTLPMAKS